MEDNLSRIDSSSEKSLDEEDEREMLGYLSEMVFTAPFEKYVENMCIKLKKIIIIKFLLFSNKKNIL